MVWHYNYNPDFIPYYDEDRGMWAVSIQYLNVWFFKTEEKAKEAIPLLKQYRLNVLKEIDKQNKAYYKRLEEEEEYQKRMLHDYKFYEAPVEKLCSELTLKEQKKLVELLDKGYSDEYIMDVLGISKRAVAIKRYHRYK